MRILLAEDERELGDWLVRALGQSGFQVDWLSVIGTDYGAVTVAADSPFKSLKVALAAIIGLLLSVSTPYTPPPLT